MQLGGSYHSANNGLGNERSGQIPSVFRDWQNLSLDEKWSWGKIKEESMVASRFLAGELFRAAALNACGYLSLLGGGK